MVKKKLPVKYNDKVLRLLLCVIAAFIVAMYGTGARYLNTLSGNSFYVKLLAAFLIACFFIEFVHLVTIQLDKVYDWKEKPLIRLTLQFLLGMLLPGIIDILFLSIYRWYFGLTVASEISSSHSSFPMMALPVFLFNIYYLFYYHILRKQESSIPSKAKTEILLIQQGTKTIPIQLSDIRFIYHLERMNYLLTVNETSYFLNETLDELERKLPEQDFIRINRKMIIHYRACLHFRSNGHGKLLLQLSPSFTEDVIVSQNRAKKFKEWISR